MSPPDRQQRRRSQRQERRTAKAMGGRVQPNSGALWGAKGDVRTDLELVESKRTDKRQITIKADWLEKIFEEALGSGRVPILGIEVGGKSYHLYTEEDSIEMRRIVEKG